MFIQKNFAHRIKKLRLEKNLTQSDLGIILAVTKTQISDLEKGKTTTSLEKLTILAQCFNVSTDYLLGLSDNPIPYPTIVNQVLFSQRLKELRQLKSLKQEDLGRLIGVTKTQISYMENSKTTTSLEKLIIIANYFNISTDYLLGRTDDPHRH